MNNQDQQLNKEPIPEQEPDKRPKPKWLVPVIVVIGVVALGLVVWGGYELFKPACVNEGETIPVIANPSKCCSGLELIGPKVPLLGIYGICTAKCGNNVCDLETESSQNCPEDCEGEIDETTNWKTYRNEEYGWEVKYPPHYEVLAGVPKHPNFRDKKYEGSFEWPGLTIDHPPVAPFYGLEVPATESKVFKLENAKENNVITVYFTDGGKKEIVSYCVLYDNLQILDVCNQILSTFKFLE